MEIPRAEQFENRAEKMTNIDFLDSNLRISFSIEPEAAEYLPEIEEKDFTAIRFDFLKGKVRKITKKENKEMLNDIKDMETIIEKIKSLKI